MMTYPKNYAPLAEEEMEYISGGLTINWREVGTMALGAGATMLAFLNIGNVAMTAGQMKQADPEKYPEPEGTLNGNLIIDATVAYFTSVGGALMGLLNVAAGVGTVYLTVNNRS